jgi:hypothetical protein
LEKCKGNERRVLPVKRFTLLVPRRQFADEHNWKRPRASLTFPDALLEGEAGETAVTQAAVRPAG